MVYAVNLGGAAALQGALAGALAGAHRGAASIPERWLLGLGEIPALCHLATRIAARRCNP
jgi:ADP-ribosylglycohydrolase